ncbi:HSF_DNA-bind domain-containing protein [Cephalotus follicularis]|uniref:HSF_DNA-bind domain-containing protein n=1 Tax=Cephalotus follicularis TaxID=3775 RepID=A0A1Q3APR1_CEPFO|nr:HSF_DNA-bind domain-containing protein [Cephalotus follicularis]
MCKPYMDTPPQPMERLHDTCPPFLTKTYDFVNDSSTNHVVSWSIGNNSFVVWDSQTFATSLLPKYFKHNNFSSFVRQLNTYGFRKVDPDRWEFAHEGFLRGQRHLLKNITRKKAHQTQINSQQFPDSCIEIGSFGLDGEVERLKRDKQVLVVELVKLRHQHQNTKASLQVMEQRIRRGETKNQQMMSFMARAMQNPSFVQQLVQQKEMRKELEEAVTKRRKRQINQGASNVEVGELISQFGIGETSVKIGITKFEESDQLDQLAMDLLGMNESQENLEQEVTGKGKEHGSTDKNVDVGFWEELLNKDIEEEFGFDAEGEKEEDVMVKELGFLGCSPM